VETIRYPYKPKLWVMLLAGLFFAGCAVILGGVARSNDRGLIINGIISFEADGATTFYWILAGVSALFVVVAVFAASRALTSQQELVIDGRAISAPKRGTSKVILTVPFANITDLRIMQVASQKFLTIHHSDGKLEIVRDMLPRKADFETVVELVEARCNGLTAH
jgi:hypothetical protein